MSIALTHADLLDAAEKGQRLQSKFAKHKEAAKKFGLEVFSVIETEGAAFAAGFARGRWGGATVVGIPADAGVGALGELIALSGVLGDSLDPHIASVSKGLLAAYFVTLGAGVGLKAKQKHDNGGTQQITSGVMPRNLPSSDRLTAEQLIQMSNAAAR